MNKKGLSVVMAGAMLATSVAPVLAAEVTNNETTHGKLGLFINDLEALMETKKYQKTDAEAGKSVYRFSILDKDGKDVTINGATPDTYTLKDGKTKIKVYSDANVLKKLNETDKIDNNYTVKVYELGSIEKNGEYFSTEKEVGSNIKYKADDFAKLVADAKAYTEASSKKDEAIKNYAGLSKAVTEGWVTNLEVKDNDSKVVVTLGSKTGDEFNKIECAVGTDKLTFARPVDAKGNVIADANESDYYTKFNTNKEYVQGNIAGFEVAKEADSLIPVPITGKNAVLLHEVKVLNGDVNYTVKVDELYDGFMLTEKGHELLNAIRTFENDKNSKTTQNVDTNITPGTGTERYFNVTLVDANGTKHVVKVLGDSLHVDRITTLKDWLKAGKADVELLAGDNRYSTAVEIAKTYLAGASQYSWDENSELVLVNGEALVDGLAAAPYAKKQGAPILLTAENSLPKETKTYMKELIAKKQVGDLNNKAITVTIVGGEAVVSQSVVNELKEIGFKVKRISGDNREETSLAVADKIGTTAKAYVVGAFGEADAMSIAAEASRDKDASTAGFQTTPIIVAKSANGLSTVGLNEVSEFTEVEIVGGEGVLPKENEDAIKELIDDETKVTRINGKNRQETNALVIKKYHKGFNDALIAKDGTRNKSELIDALPVAIFASSNSATNPSAPIVLATDSISKEQLNQLVLNADKTSAKTVYQIGNGVARSVMETVVTKLGLNK